MKIAILSSYFQNSHATANGLCARNLYNELLCEHNQVKVVCYYAENADNDNNIITVEEKREYRKNASLWSRRINSYYRLLRSFFVPYFDSKLVKQYISELERSDFLPECIIAMYFPFESIIAAYQYKLKHPEVRIIAYELDSAGDGIANQVGFNQRISNAIEKSLIHYYDGFDRIIVMRSHIEYWKIKHHKHINIMRTADIPILIRNEHMSTLGIQDYTFYSGIYTGLLDTNYRNPLYLIELLNLVNQKSKFFEVHFFSKGNCEDIIKNFSENTNYIFQHGYVDKESLDTELKKAQFLINIGNANSHSLPSKLIDYISSGKPIIHFSQQKDDVCLSYLKRYPNSLILYTDTDIKLNSEKLKSFITTNVGRVINQNYIESTFEENTPAFSVRCMFE